jgi:hypothetical protein
MVPQAGVVPKPDDPHVMVPHTGLVPNAEHEEHAVMPVGPHAIEPQIGIGPNAGQEGHAVKPVGPHVLVPHVKVPQAGLVPDAGHGGHAVEAVGPHSSSRACKWWQLSSMADEQTTDVASMQSPAKGGSATWDKTPPKAHGSASSANAESDNQRLSPSFSNAV